KPLPTEIGTNRVNWNIRHDAPPAFTHAFGDVMGAMTGDTPSWPEGPLALPGVYTVKLTVDGTPYTQTVTVKNDPRSPASAADVRRPPARRRPGVVAAPIRRRSRRTSSASTRRSCATSRRWTPATWRRTSR